MTKEQNKMTDVINRGSFDYRGAMALGHSYNQKVASVLNQLGVSCYTPELTYATSFDEIDTLTETEKDIIFTEINGHLEVKTTSRPLEEDPMSFQFPYFMVDTVNSYNKKAQKPLAYVVVSQVTQNMAVIPVSTQPKWNTEYKFDYSRKIHDDFWVCPKELVRTFPELVDYLKSIQQSPEA